MTNRKNFIRIVGMIHYLLLFGYNRSILKCGEEMKIKAIVLDIDRTLLTG
ncbi:hypothetical protein [Vagococcus sp.]|nr:hypothetical protein [Vagococcus sp.]